jgi:hypothetical protein
VSRRNIWSLEIQGNKSCTVDLHQAEEKGTGLEKEGEILSCHLMHRYNITPEWIKTIEAVRFDTHWTPDILTEIIKDPDDAIESISNDNPDVKEGIHRQIGNGTTHRSQCSFIPEQETQNNPTTQTWTATPTHGIRRRRYWGPTHNEVDKQQVGHTVG